MANKKIGLFFGSFNPIHVGHLIIANFMASQTDLAEVWLVVSPHNPLKTRQSLAKDYDRLHLVNIAIEGNPMLRACDIEFKLPKPSYTIDTLTYLKEKHPHKSFVLIMGGDNLVTLPKWKNYEQLIAQYDIYVYNRPGYPKSMIEPTLVEKISYFEAPLMQISASYIRKCIQAELPITYLVTQPVQTYIEASNMYR